MTVTAPEVSLPAVVRDYPGLRKAFAARRHELGWSGLELDHRSGLTDTYTSKLEAGIRHFGDLSLGLMLQTLGLELVVRPIEIAALAARH